MYIRSNNGTPPDPPVAPGNLQAGDPITSSSLTVTWQHPSNDETSFDLQRATASGGPWSQIATPAGGTSSHTDSGLSSNTTYFYQIRARNSAGTSAWVGPASGKTSVADDLALNANGYKRRGAHFIDLSWTGANGAAVNILLDGATIHTTTASSWTHDTGNKGGRTYVYQVCLADPPGSCSNEATVVF
jgi:hypothetical protein